MRVIFSIILLIVFTNQLHGQWISDSYLVLTNKDTLKGLLKYQDKAKVFIKISESAKSTSFTPKEVEFFKIGSDHYYSVDYTDLNSNTLHNKAFMILKVNGYIKLFEHKKISHNSFGTLETGYYPATKTSYYIRVGEDKQFVSISSGDIEDKLLRYIGDHSDLALRVKNKEFKRKDFEAIIIEYNEWKKNN